MIRFPLIQELSVDNYALYPGSSSDRAGFTTPFLPGLTLILGANGLGKTTLVWLLYRMLCGPYDISGLDSGRPLGTRRLEARQIHKTKHLFAQRVEDDAVAGEACLRFNLGDKCITIARSLNDLDLTAFRVDGTDFSVDDEETYQSEIAALAGVWSFGDWILLLRHLTFYFEDRRALVWDPSAQTQICRLLFLPPETARQWTESERQILELDSQARNLGAAVRKQARSLAQDEELKTAAPAVEAELGTLASLQESDEEKRDQLDEAILALDRIRKEARLALLTAEHEREAALRALGHAKLMALQERFPAAAETARYILAQLFAEGTCLVCGNGVPEVARSLESRVDRSRCVVCDTPIDRNDEGNTEIESLSEVRIAKSSESLERTDRKLTSARARMASREREYEDYRLQLDKIDAVLAARRTRIDTLIRRLPDEAQELRRRREEFAVLRRQVDSMKKELTARREAFTGFIGEVRESIIKHAPRIRETFVGYAGEFLLEDCDLQWSVRARRVGQTGPTVKFPVFELDLASASHQSPVRRSGPDEVSESQREFIDLAFRMALMEAADPTSGATLIIDAPESSLDAVFVRRAAEVLARFGEPENDNRLVLTSNLTDGDLIPRLVRLCDIDTGSQRLIDLFEIAEPTAAVRQHLAEYHDVKQRLWQHAQGGATE